MTPELSVVVVASWSAEAAARTVASIRSRCVEIIVVSDPDRVAPIPLDGIDRWLIGAAGDGVPDLRRVGADASTGRVVAFLEDACLVGPGWLTAILDGFRDLHTRAATGPVIDGQDGSPIDRAVYFAEYIPFAARQTRRLAGINFACVRDVLGSSGPIREHEIAATTAPIRWMAGASVRHVRHYSRQEALADRRQFGREFGRVRWNNRPGPITRLGPVAAPAILAVQLLRLAVSIMRSPRTLRCALGSSVETLRLLTAWSRGEAKGWVEARRDASRRYGRAGQRHASASARTDSPRAGCMRSPGAV
jgi:hypothetical protein